VCEGVDWINLPEDRNRWLSVVYMVMNLWVPWKVIYFVTERLLTSEEVLCLTERVG
jgi:hypothetical protein